MSAEDDKSLAGNWSKNIDIRDFIQANYTVYLGDESF
jgi:formate C-acetyltransferase